MTNSPWIDTCPQRLFAHLCLRDCCRCFWGSRGGLPGLKYRVEGHIPACSDPHPDFCWEGFVPKPSYKATTAIIISDAAILKKLKSQNITSAIFMHYAGEQHLHGLPGEIPPSCATLGYTLTHLSGNTPDDNDQGGVYLEKTLLHRSSLSTRLLKIPSCIDCRSISQRNI